MKILFIFFILGIFCRSSSAEEPGLEHANAIQIVAPVNHKFNLNLGELRNILETDEIKDRNVVVVSIAGAYRQGKCFMLDFFIKYLESQVNYRKIIIIYKLSKA